MIFVFARLYHWWWVWLPLYVFFEAFGTIGIALVLIFKRLRTQIAQRES